MDCIAEVECPATIISIMRVMIMSASGLLRGNYGLWTRGMSSVLVVYGMIIDLLYTYRGRYRAYCNRAANSSVVALMIVIVYCIALRSVSVQSHHPASLSRNDMIDCRNCSVLAAISITRPWCISGARSRVSTSMSIISEHRLAARFSLSAYIDI